MAKDTLLTLTQKVLSSIDSDPVDSITDTLESLDIAWLIRDVYFDITNNLDVPEHNELLTLTALADSTQPTHMQIPDDVTSIKEIRYDVIQSGETKLNYDPIHYVEPQEFLRRTTGRDSTDSTTTIVTITGAKLFVRNDTAPTYYTSFDDNFLIFDAHDSDVDSTLQASKFMVWGIKEPTFTMSDTFVPDLDTNLFPLLLNESKSVAKVQLQQSTNPKAEQNANRQRTRWQNDKFRVKTKREKGPDYGRQSRTRRPRIPRGR
tara:strand:- start:7637 stop:8422 length:786 start_codon:yes stop_codon:yes gene_type:complete